MSSSSGSSQNSSPSSTTDNLKEPAPPTELVAEDQQPSVPASSAMATNPSAFHSINQSMDHSNTQSMDQSTLQSTHQSPAQSAHQSPNHSPTTTPAQPTHQPLTTPSGDHWTSRHNPNFHTRNHPRLLHLHNALSSLSAQLSHVAATNDQPAFEDLYTRITTAAAGVPNSGIDAGGQRMPSGQVQSGEQWGAGQLRGDQTWHYWKGTFRTGGEGVYAAQHGDREGEGEEHERLCRERVEEARKGYFGKGEGDEGRRSPRGEE